MAGRLQARLDKIRLNFAEQVPTAVREVLHRATQALGDSGQAERALGEGDRLPAFELSDSQGAQLSSARILDEGGAVLTFFRGHW